MRGATVCTLFLIIAMVLAAEAADDLVRSGCWAARGRLVRVVDGDTFVADIFTWHSTTVRERVRVLGVDTPELGKGRGSRVEGKALEAKAFTERWLKRDEFIVTSCFRDSFGRVLGDVTRAGESLRDELLAREMGKKR